MVTGVAVLAFAHIINGTCAHTLVDPAVEMRLGMQMGGTDGPTTESVVMHNQTVGFAFGSRPVWAILR